MFEAVSARLQEVFKKLRGQGKLSERNIREGLRQVRLALLEADVNYRVARDLVRRVEEEAAGERVLSSIRSGQQVVKMVHAELVRSMGQGAGDLARASKPPTVIFLVGLQGSGKTTTAGKLAKRLKVEGRTVLLVAADTVRPAAPKQLETLAERAGVDVVLPREGMGPMDVVRDALKLAEGKGADTVIVDTQGRLHVDDELMGELVAMKREARPDEVLLVADAMTGQDAVRVAGEFEERLGIDGIVLTKLDGDARGGAALSMRAVSGKPIKFAGVGEKLDDLEQFFPERMASRILGMGDVVTLVEKVRAGVSEEETRALERKLRRETLSLEDFLQQLERMKRMGPLEDLMKLIPGMPAQAVSGLDGSELKRSEAIIRSMTPGERLNPGIMDGSRRRRIARGSGTSVQEVNGLLKQFARTKKMMGALAKKGRMPAGGMRAV